MLERYFTVRNGQRLEKFGLGHLVTVQLLLRSNGSKIKGKKDGNDKNENERYREIDA